ncbi:patatin-like phospholipase family protein [Deinococcus navajonensis]|uniref:Patatin-like phospholipase family protein n=1 Tax=Deinococcus navajonensis TaxID=309884 RepID=A0ABV8XRB6_9DEIO
MTRPKRTITRTGSGLCLSGGGYRATLFHLGAARRLNELDLLGDLHAVSSVSGGSLFAGMLATHLPWPLVSSFSRPEWAAFEQAVQRLCSQDLRTRPLLSRLAPWNWLGPGAVERMAALLDPHYGGRALHDLPPAPRFLLCATDLTFGVNWTFSRTLSGDYQAGYLDSECLKMPPALAAATSACFPPLFAPLHHPLKRRDLRRAGKAARDPRYETLLRDLRLNDGGNYDNMGLEPIWKAHELVLVSDGGSSFDFWADKGPLWRLSRYVSVLDAQSRALRRRWLMAGSGGSYSAVYWSVDASVHTYARRLPRDAACLSLGYSRETGALIGRIRTDLNRFSPEEQAILINHGYTVSDAALQAYLPASRRPAPWPSLKVPYPQFDETRARALFSGTRLKRL